MPAKIRRNDEVLIIAGKHKGERGKVVRVDHKKGMVFVDKLNLIKRHTKPSQQNPDGGVIEREGGINISNVALREKGKDNKSIKVGFVVDEKGKKSRINKRTGKAI